MNSPCLNCPHKDESKACTRCAECPERIRYVQKTQYDTMPLTGIGGGMITFSPNARKGALS